MYLHHPAQQHFSISELYSIKFCNCRILNFILLRSVGFWQFIFCPKSEAFLYLLKFRVMIVLSFTPLHGSFVEMTLYCLTTSGGIHKRRVVPRKVRLRVRYILFSIEDALGKGMRGWVTHFYVGLKGGLHFLC